MRRKRELSKEELRIIHTRVSDEEAIDEFFKHCYLKNLRQATIDYYRNEFMATKRILNKELVDLETSDIEHLIIISKERIKITTINTRLRALRAFYNFIYRKRLISTNPMEDIKLLKDRHKMIDALENSEIEKLLKVMRDEKTFVGFRDEVIFLVFLDTGIRLSELVGIEIGDIRGDELLVRKTKNNFERTVYLSEFTQQQLKRYLVIRGQLDTDALFINRDNGPLKSHSIQGRFTRYGQLAGIEKRVSPHTFRHTMAKRMVMEGIDAFSLMHLLGHTDITVTKRYVNLWGKDLKRKHGKYGALKGLRL
ncbi:tyrosine-type recombinase/integrase [Exiguobacterium alkaliphilum]|uniref:Tyrosine-type recombinase/integrase n=1 Tax=Exiguobacterium alkaliphilum TaxID=1428684 RepID=A0ABT2KYY9_9BACL|nr:tyrosine-type recombinase/integrase [Exiguobacterium alkaliphilum]MCT4796147.1 tyrosine-type recombinase/integrase [Exiguobacterium alkaliphilum]